MAKANYFTLDGDPLTEDEATNPDGTLRSGVRMHVPMFMRDGNGRTLVDAYGEPLPPKFGRRGYAFVDNSNRERPIDDSHPDVQKAYISSYWKGGLEPGDFITVDGRTLVGDGYTDNGGVEFYPIADGDALKKCAYDEAKRELGKRWKTKPMKKQKEPDEREWEVAGPLSDGQSVKDAAYESYRNDLESAWKRTP